MNADKWVEDRMRSLDVKGTWEPNAAGALARLKARRIERNGRGKTPWILAVGGISVAALAIIAFPSRGTCAQSGLGPGCQKPTEELKKVSTPAILVEREPVPETKAPAPAPAPAPISRFKESGSPDAPIVCEIYSDYECPACAQFFAQTLPLLEAKYVKTGRMRLVHRDFPLPMHPYARLAARYANAAGELGFYDAVVAQLFKTQSAWQTSGAISEQVAQAIPADAMKKLKEIVETDKTLDDTVAADHTMAVGDAIDQTPTLVFVYSGRREKVAPVGSFTVLQSYLDQLQVN